MFKQMLGGAALSLTLASPAFAAPVTCHARVALNRIYSVSLDTESSDLVVSNDAGTRVSGRAPRYESGTDGTVSYFLASGFGAGVLVEIEQGGQGRTALCLAQNECYICK